MNILALLAVALGIVALICYYAAVAAYDRNAHLCAELDAKGIECKLRKGYNEYLEWRQAHWDDVIAASYMFEPSSYKPPVQVMTVEEGQETL